MHIIFSAVLCVLLGGCDIERAAVPAQEVRNEIVEGVELRAREGDENFAELYGYDFSEGGRLDQLSIWSERRGFTITELPFSRAPILGEIPERCLSGCKSYDIVTGYDGELNRVNRFIIYVDDTGNIVCIENAFAYQAPRY